MDNLYLPTTDLIDYMMNGSPDEKYSLFNDVTAELIELRRVVAEQEAVISVLRDQLATEKRISASIGGYVA